MTKKICEEQTPTRNGLRCLLLTVAVLLVVTLIGTAAVSAEETHTHDTAWNTANSLPTSPGTYYLNTDVTLTSTWEVPNGETVFCLNGKVIKGSGKVRVIDVPEGSTLTICDCQETKRTFYETTSGNERGLWVLCDKSGCTEHSSHKTVEGGVITGGAVSEDTYDDDGGGIRVRGGTLHFKDGNIIGNKNLLSQKSGGGLSVNPGSSQDGQVTIEGGTIQGNIAFYGAGVNLVNRVSQTVNEDIQMTGGLIANNRAILDPDRPNWIGRYSYGGTGGGVYVHTENSKFVMTGGEIRDNIAEHAGGGVFVSEGYVEAAGSAQIEDNFLYKNSNTYNSNVYLLTGDGLTKNLVVAPDPPTYEDGAIIRISYGTFTGDPNNNPPPINEVFKVTESEYTPNLKHYQDTENNEVVIEYRAPVSEDEEVPEIPQDPKYPELTPDHTHNSCCDVTGWRGWNSNLPPLSKGNYVLTIDVLLNSNWVVDDDIHLCLNGKKFDLNQHHIIVTEGGSLTVHDCTSGTHYHFGESNDVEHLWVKTEETTATYSVEGGIIYNGTATTHGGAIKVEAGGALTIKNGNIIGNKCVKVADKYNSGGAIYANSGTVVIEKGTIAGNVVMGGGIGGGIAAINSTLEIGDGVTIKNNHAHGKGGGGNGGGIFLYGVGEDQKIGLKIGSATITENHAHVAEHTGDNSNPIFDSVFGDYASGNGGGIFFFSSDGCTAEITLQDTTISKNRADGRTAHSGFDERDGLGGGIYLYATGSNADNSFEMSNTKIIGNSADDGGGIHVTDGSFTMTSGEISKNTANRGGGLFAYGKGTFTMNGGKISENIVNDDYPDELDGGGGVFITDGAIFTMNGGEISDNHVTGWYGNGGGVCIDDGSLVMTGGAKIANNTATGNAGNGGGIFIYAPAPQEGSTSSTTSSFSMSDSAIVTNNTATTKTIGGTYPDKDPLTKGNGGGIYLHSVAGGKITVTLNSGTISNNTAKSEITDITSYGGGLYLYSQNVDESDKDDFTMSSGVTISGNTADRGGGLSFDGSTITINGGTISENTANFGGGIHLDKGVSFTLTDGKITKNKAGYDADDDHDAGGGGIYVHSTATLNMEGGNITENEAKDRGGGIYILENAEMTMSGGEIANNKATKFAGGVYVCGGSVFTMSGNAIIHNNDADRGGGGVAVGSANVKATFRMLGGEIYQNTALNDTEGDGGGVGVRGGSTFIMSGGKIHENKAGVAGGGVSVFKDPVSNSDVSTFIMNGTAEISGNQIYTGGSYGGGGVYLHSYQSAMEVGEGATITGNFAVANPENSAARSTGTPNNLYLPLKYGTENELTISVTKALTKTQGIGVTTAKKPVAGAPVDVATNSDGANYAAYFTSDEGYTVINDQTRNVVQLSVDETGTDTPTNPDDDTPTNKPETDTPTNPDDDTPIDKPETDTPTNPDDDTPTDKPETDTPTNPDGNTPTVIWVDEDGNVVETDPMTPGDKPSYDKPDPTKDGYEFVGWSEDPDATEGTPENQLPPMGTESVTYYPIFKKIDGGPGDNGGSGSPSPGSSVWLTETPTPTLTPTTTPSLSPTQGTSGDSTQQTTGWSNWLSIFLGIILGILLLLLLLFLILLLFFRRIIYRLLKRYAKEYGYDYERQHLKEIAREIIRMIRDKEVYPGWRKDAELTMQLRRDIIRTLDMMLYPPVPRDEISADIIKAGKGVLSRYRL